MQWQQIMVKSFPGKALETKAPAYAVITNHSHKWELDILQIIFRIHIGTVFADAEVEVGACGIAG